MREELAARDLLASVFAMVRAGDDCCGRMHPDRSCSCPAAKVRRRVAWSLSIEDREVHGACVQRPRPGCLLPPSFRMLKLSIGCRTSGWLMVPATWPEVRKSTRQHPKAWTEAVSCAGT